MPHYDHFPCPWESDPYASGDLLHFIKRMYSASGLKLNIQKSFYGKFAVCKNFFLNNINPCLVQTFTCMQTFVTGGRKSLK